MGGKVPQKQRIQAQWKFKGYEPEGCYQVTDCEPNFDMRIKTETDNVYQYIQSKDGPGCSEEDKEYKQIGL